MNRIEAQNGGYPIRWDDVMFFQNAYREAINGATAHLDNTFFSGGELTNNGTEITGGFVKINGEICFLIGGAISTQGTNPNLYIVISESDLASGVRTTQVGLTIQTHKLRRAQAVYRASPPTGGVLYSSFKTVNERLTDIVEAGLKARRIRYVGSQLTALNGWHVIPIRFTRTPDGMITMHGTIGGGSATDVHVMTLPTELRPIGLTYAFAMVRTSGTTQKENLEIHTDGRVLTTPGNEYVINLTYTGV